MPSPSKVKLFSGRNNVTTSSTTLLPTSPNAHKTSQTSASSRQQQPVALSVQESITTTMQQSAVSTTMEQSITAAMQQPIAAIMQQTIASAIQQHPSVVRISSDKDLASRRKSCEFTHHSPACIKKATSNLNLLQTQLEEWHKDVVAWSALKSQPLPEKKKDRGGGGGFNLKLPNICSGEALEIKPMTNNNPPVVVVVEPLADDKPAESQQEDVPVKFLKNVEGVRGLLGRLELDRTNRLQLLTKEEARTRKLRELLDVAAYKRIHELPTRVQGEHDKCISDIQELKWHFEYQTRMGSNLLDKMKNNENLHKKLIQDLNLVKENQPLLEEKLLREEEAMNVIQQKQDSADGTMRHLNSRLHHIQQEFEQLKVKTEEEQKQMALKVCSLSNDLNVKLDKLAHAQNEHVQMKKDMAHLESRIEEEESKLVNELKHHENLKEIGAFLKEKVAKCKDDIAQQDERSIVLKDEIGCLEAERGEETVKLNEMRRKLEMELSTNTKELRKIIMLNKKTNKEITAFKRKIENCQKARISNEKAAKRGLTELETIQDDLSVIKEQALDMKQLNGTLQIKLDQEKLKAEETEEKLKEQVTLLRMENKEESHARKILNARIKAESSSFEQKKHESELKRQKILSTDEELQKVIHNVSQQIATLSHKSEERIKTVEGLDSLIQQVGAKSNNFHQVTSTELTLLEAKDKELRNSLSEMKGNQTHVDTTTELLTSKMKDMAASEIMMKKFLASNEKAIEELQEEITELQIQLDTANELDEKLRTSLGEVETRSCDLRDKHTLLMTTRRKVYGDVCTLLADTLKENDRLATHYINIQNKHISEKNQFINMFEKNTIAEESLRDKESLCELHVKLHEALKCYYQLRGIQTKAGLSRFEGMTRASFTRLRCVQVELEKCITNVSVFLKATKKTHKVHKDQVQILNHGPLHVF